MKMKSESVLSGIKASEGEFEGTKFSSTTFYLPAEFSSGGKAKAIGSVTVPYKCGDATEFKKWEHLEHSWPSAGIPVMCEFDVVVGKDAQGKDTPKIQLLSIVPLQTRASAPVPAAARS
jgi:hypothetical protein